jgi:transmembrane 9 superfamily protein 2/4
LYCAIFEVLINRFFCSFFLTCAKVVAGEDSACKVLCEEEYDEDALKQFREKVQFEYRAQWSIDNMPIAVTKAIQDANGETLTLYETGFPIGFKGSDEVTYFIDFSINFEDS